MKLRHSNLLSNAEAEVGQLRQTIQVTGLEHAGSSTAVGRLDEVGRLSSGSDLLKSLGVILSRVEPFTKIIDNLSQVRWSYLIPYPSSDCELDPSHCQCRMEIGLYSVQGTKNSCRMLPTHLGDPLNLLCRV